MNKYIALGMAVIILIIVGPLITLWSVNTLFNTNIDYNMGTWAAAFWLTSMITTTKFGK